MTTPQLIQDLKAISLFLEHHPDALESGDFGSFSLLPLQALSHHIEHARHALESLKRVVDAEVQDIAGDVVSELQPHT